MASGGGERGQYATILVPKQLASLFFLSTPDLMSNDLSCAVCTLPGKLRCSRCKVLTFCGQGHQARVRALLFPALATQLIYPHPPALTNTQASLQARLALVFIQRPLTKNEFEDFVCGAADSQDPHDQGIMRVASLAHRTTTLPAITML